MLDSLRKNEAAQTFVNQGRSPDLREIQNAKPKAPEERIAVTVRLPKELAHQLIDESAKRRKRKDPAWSQQDIVAEAVREWMAESSKPKN
jgi:hypothetical protein